MNKIASKLHQKYFRKGKMENVRWSMKYFLLKCDGVIRMKVEVAKLYYYCCCCGCASKVLCIVCETNMPKYLLDQLTI